jgi:hypothetical protein
MNKINISAGLISLFFIGSVFADSFGWNETNSDVFIKECVVGLLEPAKKDFKMRVIDKGYPDAIFPEAKMKPSITELCTCLTQRASESLEYKEVINDSSLIQPLISEAMSGGRCKPTGVLGKMVGF